MITSSYSEPAPNAPYARSVLRGRWARRLHSGARAGRLWSFSMCLLAFAGGTASHSAASAGRAAASVNVAQAPTEKARWLEPLEPCLQALALEDARRVLELAPNDIIGFKHQKALDDLHRLARQLTCIREAVPSTLISDLWFLIGMAELYRHDEAQTLEQGGREEVLEYFMRARALSPSRMWSEATFGDFGQLIWQQSGEQRGLREMPTAGIDAAGAERIWIDGRLWSRGELPSTLPAFPHLLQRELNRVLQGSWWLPAVAPDSSVSSRADDAQAAAEVPVTGADPVEVEVGTADATSTAIPSQKIQKVSPFDGPEWMSSLNLRAWQMPLRFVGPALELGLKPAPMLELSAGAGLAFGALGEAQPALYLLVPLELTAALVWPLSGGQALAGIAYQGYGGGNFGRVEADQGAENGPKGAGVPRSAAFAHGAGAVVKLRAGRGSFRLEVRASAGALAWPQVGWLPQLGLGMGVCWTPTRSMSSGVGAGVMAPAAPPASAPKVFVPAASSMTAASR